MQAGNGRYDGPADLPAEIPLFPLKGALLLPRGVLPLLVFEPRFITLVDDALAGERLIGVIQPHFDLGEDDDPGTAPLLGVGCLGRITAFSETGDGRYQLALTGIARFRLGEETGGERPYRVAKISPDFPGDFVARGGKDEVDREGLLGVLRAYLKANSLEADWQRIGQTPTEDLVNALAMMSPYGPREKQALLEAPDLRTRAETLVAMTEMDLARSAPDDEEKPTLN